jgi:50S ribosomal subunit-associated GTPase HflX
MDLLKEEEMQEKIESLKSSAPNPVPVSALNKTNMALLEQQLTQQLKQYVRASFSIPSNSDYTVFLNWLFSRADVQSLQYEADMVHAVFESVPWFAEKVREKVTEFGGTFEKQ